MAIRQDIELNMIPNGVPPIVYVNQNDRDLWDEEEYIISDGRFHFYLKYNGERFIWNDSANFNLRGTKPNGETFEVYCAWLDASKEYLFCPLMQYMTNTAGDVYCNIEMIDGSDRVGTQAFIMRVQKEAKE
jgi:hypothetical protein